MSSESAEALAKSPAPVSVVIPCYRCVDTIGRALASVAKQTWLPAEVLLIEDASGDDTLQYLYELQAAYPEGWVRITALHRNVGPGVARNTGWDMAIQPYVAFLDADDAWHAEKIRLQLGWMLAHPQAALTGHAVQVLDTEQQSACPPLPQTIEFQQVLPLQQLLSSRFHPPATIVRKELPYRFVEGKRQSEDYLLFTEICLDGLACYRSSTPLAFLFKEHYGVSGLTGSLWLGEKGELDFYFRLARAGRIPRLSLFFFVPFSLAKYLRRLCRVALRKRSS